MNTGQSLFAIGALLILSLTVLRFNNNILQTDNIMLDSKSTILAVSLATSLIEEANRKAFDAASAENAVVDVADLTDAYSLGPGWWETRETYNDFDDFNGFTETITNLPAAIFNISCEVSYVSPDNPDGKVNYKTWHKKLTVTVDSPSMENPVILSTIYSYWNFR
ncbi:MAG: hypothetical protein Kow0098_24240 [Ignavibacteriaceae bacterium]